MDNKEAMMYLVQFTNFAYTKCFDSQEKAVAHMERAGFEAVLMTSQGHVLAKFSPISGFKNG